MAKHKPTRRPIRTDAERQQVLILHSQGTGRNAIMRETGFSAGFITTTVHDAGKSFERTGEVIAATKAKQVDNKARRAAIIDRMYGQAEKILTRLESETYRAVIKGSGGAEHVEELSDIPAADERNHLTSVAIAVDKAVSLEKIDADQGTDRAESMLDKLGTDLRKAARDAIGNVRKTDTDDSDL